MASHSKIIRFICMGFVKIAKIVSLLTTVATDRKNETKKAAENAAFLLNRLNHFGLFLNAFCQ